MTHIGCKDGRKSIPGDVLTSPTQNPCLDCPLRARAWGPSCCPCCWQKRLPKFDTKRLTSMSVIQRAHCVYTTHPMQLYLGCPISVKYLIIMMRSLCTGAHPKWPQYRDAWSMSTIDKKTVWWSFHLMQSHIAMYIIKQLCRTHRRSKSNRWSCLWWLFAWTHHVHLHAHTWADVHLHAWTHDLHHQSPQYDKSSFTLVAPHGEHSLC